MKLFVSCYAVVLALGIVPSLAGEEFVIAKEGRPSAVISVLPDSGPLVERAAADLLVTLKKMTGSDFKKATGIKESPAIVIGLASEWAKLTGDEEAVQALAEASPESFLLRSTPDRLLILGRDANGASHGIYTVLRDLGCRWYFLTDEWEVIPKKKDIAIRADRVEGPDLRNRNLSNGAGHGGASRKMMEDWSRRNRLGSAYGPRSVHHSYAGYVPNELFKERPELFAWVSKDGESKGTTQNGMQPCTTHPEVIKMFTEGALARLRKEKELNGKAPPMLPVSPNDGTGNMCRCERCMEVGNYGDTALLLANQVAEAIHDEFPDTLVGFLAYGRPSAIPENVREAHPNILVGIATSFNWKNSVQMLFQEWPKISPRTIAREYYAIMKWGSQQPDNSMPNVEYLSQSLNSWHEKGVDGIEGEIANDWASCGLRFWAFSELGWDLSLDPKALREDFYTNCWGAAAEPMRRYFERWESGQAGSTRALRLAVLDLEKAASLADTPEVARRVDQMSVYLYWYLLKRAYDPKKEEDEEQAKIALEGDLLQYRWRNAYMVQLNSSIFRVHRTAPDGFTPAEVAELRRDALERFLPASGNDLDLKSDYSINLVPFVEKHSGSSAATEAIARPAFMNASYLFRAKEGEKIEMFIGGDSAMAPSTRSESGEDPELAGIPNASDGLSSGPSCRLQLWFLGAEGREQDFIEEVHSPVSLEQPSRVSFVAPRDGLYRINSQMAERKGQAFLDFQDRPYVFAANVNRRRDFLQPVIQPPPRNTSNQDTTPPRFYFYVPKGTEAFTVNAPGARPVTFTFSTPGGDFIEEVVSTPGSESLVRVPPGRDGGIWELRPQGDLRGIALDGVPPWLAVRPEALLIPEEFAQVSEAR